MEYQKMINFDNTPNQPSKFRTEDWVEIIDDGMYDTSMHYSDAYILIKRSVTLDGAGVDNVARVAVRNDKKAMFKNCAPFIGCISEAVHK